MVLEFLAWNFCEPSAISYSETKDGQLFKDSLLSVTFFLLFSFPYSLSPSSVFYACNDLPTHSNTLSFLPSVPFFCFTAFPVPAEHKGCSEVCMKKIWMTSSQNPLNLLISLTLNVLYLGTFTNTKCNYLPTVQIFPLFCFLCSWSSTFPFQSTKYIPKCSKAKVIMIQLSFCFKKRSCLIWYFWESYTREAKVQ